MCHDATVFEHGGAITLVLVLAQAFERVWPSSCVGVRAILPGSESSCVLLRIVLQDALSEVMKVLKLKVFVDDITAFLEGRNKELAGIAEKVLTSMKKEGRREDSKVVEGKSEVIAKRSFKNAAKEKEWVLRPALKRWEWT